MNISRTKLRKPWTGLLRCIPGLVVLLLITFSLVIPSSPMAQEEGSESEVIDTGLDRLAQIRVMKALEKRRLNLEMREEQLNALQGELGKLQEELLQRLGEIELKNQELSELKMEVDKIDDIDQYIAQAREKFDQHLMDIAEGKAEEVQKEIKTQRLTKVVSSMRPDEAAMLLEKMDRALVAQILSHMSERKVAKIMEAMSPLVSSALGEMITK